METKKKLKSCNNGHQFFKNSDFGTCPICEDERNPKESFLALISAPARRALERNNIKNINDLAKWSEKDILNLHGIGPSTIPKLNKALSQNGLSFTFKP